MRKVDRYMRLMIQQHGKCAICLREPNGRPLDEDHDHVTGEVRGLLCRSCNTAIGKFGDNPATLERAIDYLKHPPYRAVSIDL